MTILVLSDLCLFYSHLYPSPFFFFTNILLSSVESNRWLPLQDHGSQSTHLPSTKIRYYFFFFFGIPTKEAGAQESPVHGKTKPTHMGNKTHISAKRSPLKWLEWLFKGQSLGLGNRVRCWFAHQLSSHLFSLKLHQPFIPHLLSSCLIRSLELMSNDLRGFNGVHRFMTTCRAIYLPLVFS